MALETGRRRWYAAAGLLFVAALFSKESAAALPAMLFLVWWIDGRPKKAPLIPIALMAAVTLLYALASFSAADHHLHLNDGTFSWSAPFPLTLAHSLWRMLFPWGLAALGLLVVRDWKFAAWLLVFAAFALGPYSFLTYMNRVPSRHTYWAAVAVSLLIGRGFVLLAERRSGRWAAVALGLIFAVHNAGYLWIRKVPQYRERAAPTEEFLSWAARRQPPVALDCAPYRIEVFDAAARIRLGWRLNQVRARARRAWRNISAFREHGDNAARFPHHLLSGLQRRGLDSRSRGGGVCRWFAMRSLGRSARDQRWQPRLHRGCAGSIAEAVGRALRIVTHETNRGYGAALGPAFSTPREISSSTPTEMGSTTCATSLRWFAACRTRRAG